MHGGQQFKFAVGWNESNKSGGSRCEILITRDLRVSAHVPCGGLIPTGVES